MKYLCLVFIEEKKLEALSGNESQSLDDESLTYDDTLRQGGHLIAAQALQLSRSAATVRVRRDKVLVTDGPFAETKEQVGGFVLIEARDLKEAIQLASKIPVARLGAIEVRAVKELTRSTAR
jgi:hypothetical protein